MNEERVSRMPPSEHAMYSIKLYLGLGVHKNSALAPTAFPVSCGSSPDF